MTTSPASSSENIVDGQRITDKLPVIVGDCYELAETASTIDSGELPTDLLAQPANSAALLPMSGYEKSSIAELNGFDIARQSQDFDALATYSASSVQHEPVYQYALPGHHVSQLEPNATAYENRTNQTAIYNGTSSVPQHHEPYITTGSSYRDVESRKNSEICTRFEPRTGIGGTLVYVNLDSSSDLQTPSPLILSLIFEKRRVPATLRPLEHQAHDDGFKYVVSGVAPPFSDMETPNPFVSLRLQYQDATGQNIGLIDIGIWQYEDEGQLELRSSPVVTRKRKSTSDSQGESALAKRFSPSAPQSDALHLRSYSSASTPIMEYPQAMHPIDWNAMQRKLTPYGRSQDQQSLRDTSTDMSPRNTSGGLPVCQTLMKPPMTQISCLSPPYMTSYQFGRSPLLKPIPPFPMPSSSPRATNPVLVRASTIQQHSPGPNPALSSADGSFNSYAMLPKKADINILGGDLNSMQDNWTTEERAAKRRLVRFRGEQIRSTINIKFKAVKPDERPTSHETRERRVSCIYWEERDEYFVTSVDTIALLETLVGARFQVQEKNRIRRNLETHQPWTVAKGKPETESFFKVIMGLPNPKPRNIEKDVKVFPWPILGQALRKVIGKYSPSPASTAGPLSTSNSLNYNAGRSDADSDRYTRLSSRSSTGSSTYASTLSSSTLSPPTPSQGLSTQYSQASALPMTIPSQSRSYDVPSWADKYLQDDGGTSFESSSTYLPSVYPAYMSSSLNRRRSDDDKSEARAITQYPTRPRANTSFSALYQATQDPSSDYSLSHMPSSVQASRPSWDISAFFRGDLGSFSNDVAHGTQYRLPSRQNPSAPQYPQVTMEAPPTQ